jgi:histidinol-phosphate aminotransferase
VNEGPEPAPIVRELPQSRPFIGPEELARRAGRGALLRLGANESAFGPPPRALAAMREQLERTAWYGDPESNDLREAIAARHGCGPENVSVGAGIDDLLGLAVRAYLAPGDVTVATSGSYPTYVYHVLGYGARLETVPYTAAGSVNLEALAAHAHAANARQVYLANPDNPSGAFAGKEAVAAFVAALPPRALLVLDEAYADFVAPHEVLGDAIVPRVVRMRTFSKAYGLAGARVAYAIGAPGLIATFGKIRLQYGVNRTAQIGALVALDERAFVDEVISEVERGRADYRAMAARHGLATLPSRTNFVCIDLGSRQRAEAMVGALLARGVFVRKPGLPPLDGHIRVTVGTQGERDRLAPIFAEALATLAAPASR